MKFRIGLENGIEGKALAWVLEHPGCFASADDIDAVLKAIPEAIQNYASWVSKNKHKDWIDTKNIQLTIEETWQVYSIDEGYKLASPGKDSYEVNAWFLDDWKPLTRQEIERGYMLLTWSRQDFFYVIKGLSANILEFQPPGERWSIKGIIRHVGIAEWWYMDRLNLTFPFEALPSDPFDIIRKSRESLLTILPGLENKSLVTGVEGEFWSPRKLLRRALWHERNHTGHIQKLLKMAEIE